MKAIEINEALENEFLKAAKLAGIRVQKLHKVAQPGKAFYWPCKVTSFSKIFMLGLYFEQLTFQKIDNNNSTLHLKQ